MDFSDSKTFIQFNKFKSFVMLFFVLVLMTACGGGNPEKNKEPTDNVTTPSPSPSPSPSSGDDLVRGVTSDYDPSYCAEFVIAATEADGNMFTFEAPGNDCFGIESDGAQKKTIPLTLSGDEDEFIKIGSSIRLYNSTPEVANFRRANISFDITNISAFPRCFVNPDMNSVSLFDVEGKEIALLDSDSYLNGALYSLSYSGVTNTCLKPGQTLSLVSGMYGLPVDVVDAAAYAVTGPVSGSDSASELLPTLAASELVADGASLEVSFINDTGTAIQFDFSIFRVSFFDAEGYSVHHGFLRLEDNSGGLNIVESGERFILNNASVLSRRTWPAHAVIAVIHLDWEYFE